MQNATEQNTTNQRRAFKNPAELSPLVYETDADWTVNSIEQSEINYRNNQELAKIFSEVILYGIYAIPVHARTAYRSYGKRCRGISFICHRDGHKMPMVIGFGYKINEYYDKAETKPKNYTLRVYACYHADDTLLGDKSKGKLELQRFLQKSARNLFVRAFSHVKSFIDQLRDLRPESNLPEFHLSEKASPEEMNLDDRLIHFMSDIGMDVTYDFFISHCHPLDGDRAADRSPASSRLTMKDLFHDPAGTGMKLPFSHMAYRWLTLRREEAVSSGVYKKGRHVHQLKDSIIKMEFAYQVSAEFKLEFKPKPKL